MDIKKIIVAIGLFAVVFVGLPLLFIMVGKGDDMSERVLKTGHLKASDMKRAENSSERALKQKKKQAESNAATKPETPKTTALAKNAEMTREQSSDEIEMPVLELCHLFCEKMAACGEGEGWRNEDSARCLKACDESESQGWSQANLDTLRCLENDDCAAFAICVAQFMTGAIEDTAP